MKTVRLFLIALASLVLAACMGHGGGDGAGGGSYGAPGNPGSPGSPGKIQALYTLPNGADVNTLTWTIANTADSYTGTADVSQSNTFDADGIAPGTGYVLTVTATSTDGEQCSGASAAFPVSAGQISYVSVDAVCVVATSPDAGTVVGSVTFTQTDCASMDPLVAPDPATVGGPDVPVFAHVDAPAGVTFNYTWSVNAGSLAATDGGTLVLTVTGTATGSADLVVFFAALPESNPWVNLTITYPGSSSCPAAATTQTVTIP